MSKEGSKGNLGSPFFIKVYYIMTYLKEILAYIISFIACILVLDYLLDLPKYIIENNKVVDLYTHKYFLKTFLSEMLVIAIYIGLSEIIIKMFDIKENYKKLLIVTLITSIISSLFVISHKYFLNTNVFFNRWFKASGWTFVLYEIIMVGTIYHVYDHILEKIF